MEQKRTDPKTPPTKPVPHKQVFVSHNKRKKSEANLLLMTQESLPQEKQVESKEATI